MDKKFVSTIISHIRNRTRGRRDHNIIHPTREWFLGLLGATIGLIGGSLFSVNLYQSYKSLSPEPIGGNGAAVTVYREREVEKALTTLTERAAEHESILTLLTQKATTPGLLTPPPEPEPAIPTPLPTSTPPLIPIESTITPEGSATESDQTNLPPTLTP